MPDERGKVEIVDTTLRDGQQSLWATRMTTAMVLPTLPLLDRAGFATIECMATVVMDSCVRYLKENPWERLRLIRERVHHTPLGMMAGSVFSVGSRGILPDDLLTLYIQRCAANGIDRFFFQDGLNDQRNLRVPVRAAKEAGAFVWGGLTFSISPAHTDEHFRDKVADVLALGVDAIVLKDPNGLLTPERIKTLVPLIRSAAGDVPVYCHSHCNTGMGPASNFEAVQQGAAGIWTSSPPLANASALPPTPGMVRGLRHMGYEVDVDLDRVGEVSEHLYDLARRHDKPIGTPADYDPASYDHQMPGGMISNFKMQLAQLGIGDRLQEVLEEIPAVRADLGWSIMVTPFSQMLATQAALNVIYGRYAVVPDEVQKLVLGYYGTTPAPISPEVLDRIGGGKEQTSERPGDLIPLVVDRIRKEQGPFESDEDLLLAAFFMPDLIRELRESGPIQMQEPQQPTSVVRIVQEAAKRPGVTRLALSRR